jgi:enamine deaminase RidA (YjgF/YER057c/UK114 family)
MTRRLYSILVLILTVAVSCPGAEEVEPSVRYVPLDAPAGMSQAVVVEGQPLIYTRQLLPLADNGEIVGTGDVDKQIQQLLDNLEAVLTTSGSSLNQIVRLNVYALSNAAVDQVRKLLAARLEPAVRPAITAVLTSLPHRDALVAVDALAVGTAVGDAVKLSRCQAVSGDDSCADVATLPPGGVAYLSGVPESGALTESAVTRSMAQLLATLKKLELAQAHVVQLKVFLTPASSAEAVSRELQKLFPNQLLPPVVFVEWIASVPVEIELVAQFPKVAAAAGPVQYYNPPEVIPSPTFTRVALVHSDKQIFISSLWAREDGEHEARGVDVFEQLKNVLAQTGSDLRHMVKATYYVSDDETSGVLNKLRPALFDPERPPAASKATVHGVGKPGRTLSIDMIAVGKE